MNHKNTKAATGSIVNGFLNHSITGGNQMNISTINHTRKSSENKRFCKCGTEIPRSAVLLCNAKICDICRAKESVLTTIAETVITTPHRVIKCKSCRSCKKGYAPQMLVPDLRICRNCLTEAQTENPSKQRRLIAGIVANFEASLRRQVLVGGQHA